MSYILDSSPSIFRYLSDTGLTAREEIFTFLNHREKSAIIFDFERRRVNSRCIVRMIDYRGRRIAEKRSRTLRFTIKSTFAARPFEDEGITFTGGGFTASAVARNNTYRIIAALPDMVLADGTTGLKARLSFSLEKNDASFNLLYSKGRSVEAIHSSLAHSASGLLIMNGKKTEIRSEDYTVERIWKSTTFPLRRNSYSSYCYGRGENPYAFILSIEEKKCIAVIDGKLRCYSGVEMKKNSDGSYTFCDRKDVEIHFSVFSTVNEKTGPFRQNRILMYGLFSGHISSSGLDGSFGCIEL